MNQLSFLLPQPVVLPRPHLEPAPGEIKYYSDCVFNPYVHDFAKEQLTTSATTLTLDFSFLLEAVKKFPKILDNIGVLKLGTQARYGVLLTKEKQGYYLSIID